MPAQSSSRRGVDVNETTITQRTDKVRKAAADQGVDGILLGLPENMYYFSG
ncbi:MAG: aminopeptidase P family N-terminal domain-containing protein, partial [Bacillota bacterium]